MASSCGKSNLTVPLLLASCLLLLLHSAAAAASTSAVNGSTLRPSEEIAKRRRIVSAHLKRVNKPSVKTIKSPDGDLIDCVPSHLQPAFDHPKLRGQKPLDPPERPGGHNLSSAAGASLQAWATSGESCPQGTVPIRRTSREDVLRASSLGRFGRKPAAPRRLRRDSTSTGHEETRQPKLEKIKKKILHVQLQKLQKGGPGHEEAAFDWRTINYHIRSCV